MEDGSLESSRAGGKETRAVQWEARVFPFVGLWSFDLATVEEATAGE